MPRLDAQYVERMEDVLSLYEKPLSSTEPVVCFDERPVQLLGWHRQGTPMRRGRPARFDYEYERCGSANLFCAVEPKAGWHWVKATRCRKADDFAHALRDVAAHYPQARRIHLVFDNLSTHSPFSLTRTFGWRCGQRLWKRFCVHRTPVHGSWLNQAEAQTSMVSRQCLGKRRIPDVERLGQEVRAWARDATRRRVRIRWTFTVPTARRTFHYRSANATFHEASSPGR
jgi:hypothetical protein